jgi:amino acid transporter
MMPDALLNYFGMFANQIVAALLLSSMFASTLSLQNILSRYTHSLSVDGILPRVLAAVHPKHGSPYISALAVGGVVLLSLIALIFTNTKELALYGAAAGIAFYGMLLLHFMTSVAVLIFFRRKENDGAAWKTFVAPLIAAIGIGLVLLTATTNIELLIDAPHVVIWSLLAITYVSVALGVIVALVLKRRGSKTYDRIGRRVD